jgi:hypothetical protein
MWPMFKVKLWRVLKARRTGSCTRNQSPEALESYDEPSPQCPRKFCLRESRSES